jgi:hypothetical protein
MRFSIGLFFINATLSIFLGCKEPVVTAPSSSNFQIQSLVATPSVVPAGVTSMIACKIEGNVRGTLNYNWKVTGAYEYITPIDSICIFASPSCHSGPATVTVNVSDGTGASVSGSVNIN